MFVVRIIKEDDQPDFKAFVHRPDAQKRFEAGKRLVWNNTAKGAVLYEASFTAKAGEAVEAVRTADSRIVLLETDGKAEYDKNIDKTLDELLKDL